MDHGAHGEEPMPGIGMKHDMPGMDHGGMKHDMTGMESPIVGRHGPDTHGPGNAAVAQVQRNRLGEPGTGLHDVGHRVLVYNDLVSLEPSKDPRPPEREIELHLTGNMEAFMWGIDGKKFSEAPDPIPARIGERVRITLVNDTMMEHPMHLHGVFMELDNGRRLPQAAQAHHQRQTGRAAFFRLYVRRTGQLRLPLPFPVPHGNGDVSLPQCAVRAGQGEFMKSLLLTVVGLHSLLLAGLAAAQEKPFPLPPKDWPQPVMDRQVIPFLLVDRLEYAWKKGNNSRAWDIQGWFGGDYNKFWFKTEGEDEVGGRTEAADLQALYARRISPFWHFQTGILP